MPTNTIKSVKCIIFSYTVGSKDRTHNNPTKTGMEYGRAYNNPTNTGMEYGRAYNNHTNTGMTYGRAYNNPTNTGMTNGRAHNNPTNTGMTYGRAYNNLTNTGMEYGRAYNNHTNTGMTYGGAYNNPTNTGMTYGGAQNNPTNTGMEYGRAYNNPTNTGMEYGRAYNNPTNTGMTYGGAHNNPTNTGMEYGRAYNNPTNTGMTYGRAYNNPTNTGMTNGRAHNNPTNTGMTNGRAHNNPTNTGMTYGRAYSNPTNTGMTYGRAYNNPTNTGMTYGRAHNNPTNTGMEYGRAHNNVDDVTKMFEHSSIQDNNKTIMTINVSNNKQKGSANAEQRRQHVSDLISGEFPDIVLLQECIKKELTTTNARVIRDGKKGYNFVYKDAHAGVMVKKGNTWTQVYVEDKDLVNFQKLREAGVKTRLSLIELEVDKNKIIIGSWHGPKAGNDYSRVSIFIQLCKYMNLIAKRQLWIIGGDFNLNFRKVEEKVPENTCIFSGEQENIIYFVHTKSVYLNHWQTCEKTDSYGSECIDHYPLLALLEVE